MSDLAVQNRESEQEVMPSFDFLLERETERNTLLRAFFQIPKLPEPNHGGRLGHAKSLTEK